MIESELRKAKRLSVSSRIPATTEIGKVIKLKVVFKGNPRTVYTPPELSYFELEERIENIKCAEQLISDPNVIREYKNQETTPKKFIEEKSLQYIKDSKANISRDEIIKNDLFILIQQRAWERLFNKDINNSEILPK